MDALNPTSHNEPFVPSEQQVEFAYIDRRDFEAQVSHVEGPTDAESHAEFRRFLAKVGADAIRNAATYWGEHPDEVDDETPRDSRNWLRSFADLVETGMPL